MMQARLQGESTSAYRYRATRYCLKWLCILGLSLLVLIIIKPSIDNQTTQFIVFFLYIGLSLGSLLTLIASVGFAIGAIWAKLNEKNIHVSKRWHNIKNCLYLFLMLIVYIFAFYAVFLGLSEGKTFWIGRYFGRGSMVSYIHNPFIFILCMGFFLIVIAKLPIYMKSIYKKLR